MLSSLAVSGPALYASSTETVWYARPPDDVESKTGHYTHSWIWRIEAGQATLLASSLNEIYTLAATRSGIYWVEGTNLLKAAP